MIICNQSIFLLFKNHLVLTNLCSYRWTNYCLHAVGDSSLLWRVILHRFQQEFATGRTGIQRDTLFPVVMSWWLFLWSIAVRLPELSPEAQSLTPGCQNTDLWEQQIENWLLECDNSIALKILKVADYSLGLWPSYSCSCSRRLKASWLGFSKSILMVLKPLNSRVATLMHFAYQRLLVYIKGP